MSTGGPSGFGSGGVTNAYPSRTYPSPHSPHTNDDRDTAAFVGGQRGPAAIPSRSVPNPGNYPAPYDPRIRDFNVVGQNGAIGDGTGQQGPVLQHRGAFVEDAGAPRMDFGLELGHNQIPWSRPTYPNVQGLMEFRSPTQMPSWTANRATEADAPASPIPVQKKHIGQFTVRKEYGSTNQFFNNGSLQQFVAGLPSGMNQQGRRWIRQAKWKNPWLINRAEYGTAGSFGQTTRTLATAPTNLPGGSPSNPYGSY